MIKIYFSEDNELSEFSSIEKGCRLDVLVEINGKYYKPLINTISRLVQEANDAFDSGQIYDNEPCQILVREASKELIIKSIIEHDKQKFFDYFIPFDLHKYYENDFPRLGNISNWTKVY